MNLYEAFEKTLVDEGKEFPLSDTAFITLLPTSGDKARRKFEQMMEPYAARLKTPGGRLTEEENSTLNVRLYAEHIILGWRGLKDRDNKEIVYSKENAKLLLSDKKLETFFALIIKIAADDASFEAKQIEEDSGNSSTS